MGKSNDANVYFRMLSVHRASLCHSWRRQRWRHTASANKKRYGIDAREWIPERNSASIKFIKRRHSDRFTNVFNQSCKRSAFCDYFPRPTPTEFYVLEKGAESAHHKEYKNDNDYCALALCAAWFRWCFARRLFLCLWTPDKKTSPTNDKYTHNGPTRPEIVFHFSSVALHFEPVQLFCHKQGAVFCCACMGSWTERERKGYALLSEQRCDCLDRYRPMAQGLGAITNTGEHWHA